MIISKIKELAFLKYGINLSTKHIWMVIVLFISLLLLLLSLLLSPSRNKDQLVPKPNIYTGI